jgi:hypothetical protein
LNFSPAWAFVTEIWPVLILSATAAVLAVISPHRALPSALTLAEMVARSVMPVAPLPRS